MKILTKFGFAPIAAVSCFIFHYPVSAAPGTGPLPISITCTSNANNSKTISGTIPAGAFAKTTAVVGLSPSGGSVWVIAISNFAVRQALNCYTDYQMALVAPTHGAGLSTEVDTAYFPSNPLCQQYGPTAGIAASYNSFAVGGGTYLKNCKILQLSYPTAPGAATPPI